MSQMVDRIDDYGRAAWLGLMVVAFILFWPAGLALLAFLIWSGRMGCGGRMGWGDEARRERFERKMERMREKFNAWGGGPEGHACKPGAKSGFAPSGNRAFDEYRAETLRRLEQEAQDFHGFLDQLRMAKDKSEFDQFMTERRNRPAGSAEPQPPANPNIG